ncbi:hypothetical protein EYF80_062775 [Liparis tanakae]|uniref:Uncharacterized protein n=1 Tax=Liparis tanakae TaxID=230148 RepID=A0A4Z2EEA9_9TELE|nr:hypothetical protein EYF80_062775 [Liparis tanakae]
MRTSDLQRSEVSFKYTTHSECLLLLASDRAHLCARITGQFLLPPAEGAASYRWKKRDVTPDCC